MLPPPFERCLVLTGPTGSGKSRLALDLAERLGAEIVSLDSMALYRGMDICTAKPSLADRERVPHHLLDVLDPWEMSSVAWWLDRARESVADIQARGKRVLFVGGTPLYLQALLHGLFDGPPADDVLRAELEQISGEELHRRLLTVDPVCAGRLHPNDVRRLVRALEVYQLTGRPLSEWQQQWAAPAVVPPSPDGIAPEERCLWLDLPREELYARIDARVLQMMQEGLEDEIRRLRSLPQGMSKQARQALGVEELSAYLDGKEPREVAVARLQQHSRNYAKRQLTWFRRISACQASNERLTFHRWGLTIE